MKYWAVCGLTLVLIPYLCTYLSLVHVGASRIALIQALSPLMTTALVCIGAFERVSGARLAGVVVGLVGTAIVVYSTGSQEGAGGSNLYLWFGIALLAPLSYAVCNVAAGHLKPPGLSIVASAAGANLMAAVAFLAASPFLVGLGSSGRGISGGSLVPGLLAILVNGIASMLFFSIVSVRGSVNVSLATYATAFVGVGLGWLFLSERVSLLLVLGGAVVLVGVAVSAGDRSSRAAAPV